MLEELGLIGILGLAIRAAWIDAKTGLLPNRLNLQIFITAVIWALAFSENFNFLEYISVTMVHLFLVVWPRAGLGAGDLKLIVGLALISASFSFSWVWLLLAYVLAAIQGIFRPNSKTIRFGPWLVTAWVVVGMGELPHVAMAYSW